MADAVDAATSAAWVGAPRAADGHHKQVQVRKRVARSQRELDRVAVAAGCSHLGHKDIK